ncbi:prepilin-type N-terminal cleavage/methylation domain-containing protein [Candidatus Saccharibacteria bacterium]|nr:prepilin-type N-terminal cleavage/methylation domain-containing protein [Candidatus Saccharibacteria bacterium]
MLKQREAGFTLIELLMAMAIFSFMLTIIITGFVNVVGLHNQSVAANVVQDNAQTIIATMTREIREGTGLVLPSTAQPNPGYICMNDGTVRYYVVGTTLVKAVALPPNCAKPSSPIALSSSTVHVASFVPTFEAGGLHPTIGMQLEVTTPTGTVGSGIATQCLNKSAAHFTCATVVVNSAASPRGESQ